MPRGGSRPGAGRKARGSAPARTVSVPLAPEERAELEGGLREGETIAGLLRDAGLREVRKRARKRAVA